MISDEYMRASSHYRQVLPRRIPLIRKIFKMPIELPGRVFKRLKKSVHLSTYASSYAISRIPSRAGRPIRAPILSVLDRTK